jgi:hypothetical protein
MTEKVVLVKTVPSYPQPLWITRCQIVQMWLFLVEIDYASLDAFIAFGVGTCFDLSPSCLHLVGSAVGFPFVPGAGICVGVHQ